MVDDRIRPAITAQKRDAVQLSGGGERYGGEWRRCHVYFPVMVFVWRIRLCVWGEFRPDEGLQWTCRAAVRSEPKTTALPGGVGRDASTPGEFRRSRDYHLQRSHRRDLPQSSKFPVLNLGIGINTVSGTGSVNFPVGHPISPISTASNSPFPQVRVSPRLPTLRR